MRKKTNRRSPSRKPVARPATRSPLQIQKETIRTLDSDDLTQVVTGQAPLRNGDCPNSRTQTGDV